MPDAPNTSWTPCVLVDPATREGYAIIAVLGNGIHTSVTPIVLIDPATRQPYKAGTGGSGSGVTTGSESVVLGDSVVVITHNLNNVNAVLVAAFPDWFGGFPRINAQDADTITIEFPQENPNDPGTVKWGVVEP